MAARKEATPEAARAEATMPDWRYVVVTYEDPYSKEILQAQQPEPGMCYIGTEVKIRNNSDMPLAVSPGQIRLRDGVAVTHTNGGTVGSNPRLYDVNMLHGERVRGWVWSAVPEVAQLGGLVYVPATSQLRVDVMSVSSSG